MPKHASTTITIKTAKTAVNYRQTQPPTSVLPQGAERILSAGSTGCNIFFGIIWTLFSAIFVFAGIGFYVQQDRIYDLLSQEGVKTQAVITDKYISTDSDGDDTFYIYYQYQVSINGDPTQLDAQQNVSRSLYNQLEQGQTVEILYAPSQPETSQLMADFGPPDIILPLIFVCMGSLFVMIGLGILFGPLIKRKKQNG